LLSLIQYFRPRQLVVVGDLFHSKENKELDLFLRWREDFPHLGIRLVMGNHDILRADWYEKAGIAVTEGILVIGEFAFVHDIEDAAEHMPYYFSGHLHPAIRVNGIGKQSLQFPCFYFGAEYAILPAFGRFTGTVSIDPGVESNVFAILPQAQRERRPASIYQIQ
jgi:DNA ligase-associated metallophosphoesterase